MLDANTEISGEIDDDSCSNSVNPLSEKSIHTSIVAETDATRSYFSGDTSKEPEVIRYCKVFYFIFILVIKFGFEAILTI